MKHSLPNFPSKGTLGALVLSLMSFSVAADTMYVSHGVKTNDPVYPYTGFSTNEDVPGLSIAVKLTNDMLAPYAGASITALHIGWAGIYQQSTPTATAFLRSGLNGENITTAEVELNSASGWNSVIFTEPYIIQENDELFMGYVVDSQKGVYGPCTLTWGSFEPETHFIANPEIVDEEGNMEWIDLSTPGLMEMQCPIMLVAEVEVGGGEYQNKILLTKAVTPSMLLANTPTGADVQLLNTGSNDVESVTVSCSQEGQDTWSYVVNLSSPIAVGSSGILSVPVYAGGKGETTLSISEVNGNTNGEEASFKFSPVVIPQEVAERYTRRPLMEYFASESEYRSAEYDDNIVTPIFEGYSDRISRINWHTTDQYQLGLADDRDEALSLAIEIAKNDSSQVYMPTVMVDRDMNLGIEPRFCLTALPTPMLGIIYSPFAESSYEYALAQPTFAALNIEAQLEGDVVTLNIEGDADTSVLPEGENLMLTVVLVEDGIESDSQEFPGGTGEGSNPGHTIHNCLVRQLLTDIWGDVISFTDGKFSASYTTELDYDNVAANMRAVAFINRPKENGMWERSVINSAECSLADSGVRSAFADTAYLRPTIEGNSIICPAWASMQVYTSAGISVPAYGLQAGIYLVKVTGVDGVSATFKMFVK
ncbi:MAG: Omp28-related outer membrane protein [Muribaculaceae bacterium]|nr:Omp28-related outer membrane protein [Muribaculaceae bacterium]